MLFVPANILLNRPTFQSKDYDNRLGFLAVDGKYDTDGDQCTHTENPWQAWWAVDMGKEYAIASVTVTNKIDTYGK